MTRRILRSSVLLVVAVAAVLVTTAQGQAAPPVSATDPSAVGQMQRGVFRHRFFPGGWRFGFGNPYLFNPYYNFDYTYAIAREQQYRASLLQLEQYRVATQYLQLSASLRHQANELRSLQARQAEVPAPYAQTELKRTSSTPEVVLTAEDRASAKLKMATVLAEDGKAADAAEYYREIVRKYPGTLAALQAQESLEKGR